MHNVWKTHMKQQLWFYALKLMQGARHTVAEFRNGTAPGLAFSPAPARAPPLASPSLGKHTGTSEGNAASFSCRLPWQWGFRYWDTDGVPVHPCNFQFALVFCRYPASLSSYLSGCISIMTWGSILDTGPAAHILLPQLPQGKDLFPLFCITQWWFYIFD